MELLLQAGADKDAVDKVSSLQVIVREVIRQLRIPVLFYTSVFRSF